MASKDAHHRAFALVMAVSAAQELTRVSLLVAIGTTTEFAFARHLRRPPFATPFEVLPASSIGMDLSTAANLAEVLGALTIVGGAAYGALQLREFTRQRRAAGAFAFFNQWTSEASRDLMTIDTLPDTNDEEVILARIDADPELQRAAYSTYANFERLGMLVYQRHVELADLNEWAGGILRRSWRKLKPWLERERAKSGFPRLGEWFQWLAERVEEHEGRSEDVAAHVAYRDWRP